jgi:prevent-host-death family protein
MKVAAGKFKAECLKLMDRVAETGEPIVITKRGKIVARLVPAHAKEPTSIVGCMKDTVLYVAPENELFSTGERWDVDR